MTSGTRWNEEQNKKVADKAAHIIFLLNHRGRGFLTKAVDKAQQEVLPKDQWRLIRGMGSVKFVAPLIEHNLKLLGAPPLNYTGRQKRKATLAKAGVVVKTPSAKPVIPAPVTPTPVPAPVPPLTEVQDEVHAVSTGDRLTMAVRTFAETVAFEIKTALEHQLASVISDALAQALESVHPAVDKKVASHKERLNKVLVLGPKNDQQQVLKQEFEGLLDLRFVSSSEGAPRVSQMCKTWRGPVVIWTNFTDHAMQNSVKAAGLSPVFASGGMSELKDVLIKLAVL